MRLFLILLLGTLYCCSLEPTYFAPKLVEELARYVGAELPSAYNNIELYVRTDTSGICQTAVGALYCVYKAGYRQHYATFPLFLAHALNQRIAVASALLHQCGAFFFPLDSAAAAHYARLSPSARRATLCQPLGRQRWTLKPEVARAPSRQTALYYLFLGNCGIGFDDYNARYFITEGFIKTATAL